MYIIKYYLEFCIYVLFSTKEVHTATLKDMLYARSASIYHHQIFITFCWPFFHIFYKQIGIFKYILSTVTKSISSFLVQ